MRRSLPTWAGGEISSFAGPAGSEVLLGKRLSFPSPLQHGRFSIELLMVVPPIHQNAEFRGIGEVAVLAEQRILYVGRGGNDAHETGRMKIPPLPTPVTKPWPPQVTSISVLLRQSIGGEVVVMGAGFTGATKVAIFDDAAGNEVLVRFESRSDSELSFKMPTLSKHCRHAAIIVLTPGGVTVTLPKLCSVAKPLILEPAARHQAGEDRRKAGPERKYLVRGRPAEDFAGDPPPDAFDAEGRHPRRCRAVCRGVHGPELATMCCS